MTSVHTKQERNPPADFGELSQVEPGAEGAGGVRFVTLAAPGTQADFDGQLKL